MKQELIKKIIEISSFMINSNVASYYDQNYDGSFKLYYVMLKSNNIVTTIKNTVDTSKLTTDITPILARTTRLNLT